MYKEIPPQLPSTYKLVACPRLVFAYGKHMVRVGRHLLSDTSIGKERYSLTTQYPE